MNADEKLIFLISQPRSGSTLTQKILGSHNKIYTRSEPWIMLHPLYGMKTEGIVTDYDIDQEHKAVNDFISGLPGKEDFYHDKLREMYLSLYLKYLNKHNKTYFLDKTPRYYLIVDELLKIFPHAKQIILIRNPLAVLGSLIPRKETWYKLAYNRHDLIDAVDVLVNIVENKALSQYILKFEDLLNDQVQTIQLLCEFLGIEFDNSMLIDFLEKTDNWNLGDQKIYKQSTVDKNKQDYWMEGLNEPQYWRVIYDYLNVIGKTRYQILGYDFDTTMSNIIDKCPLESVREVMNCTLGLNVFLENARDSVIENLALKKRIQEKQQVINQKEQQLNNIYASKTWKLVVMITKVLTFHKK